jgi:large subunit ribosomal protein L1
MNRGKKYKEKFKLVDREKLYSIDEAFQMIKQASWAKFDETIDLAIKLGVDPKKNPIRSTVSLPAGSGKTKKIAVITKPDKIKEAEEAKADVVGSEDLVEKIKNGFFDFDILIVTPDMMGVVGRLGKILGPKGLMPNPKTGTVTTDIAKTVKEFKGGKIEFRVDKGAVLHMILGKLSFEPSALESNFLTVLSAVVHARPHGFKGIYIRSITVSSSMGAGIKIDPKQALEKVS